ncbi:MAG: YihY/virulence factor BrkB family protein [Planctomycetes bacterium]|nr:YihY/virulence factor BrkB family protein [Planctomycetota bacterium]
METQTDSNTQPKLYSGKLCIAASICLLAGISLFFLSLLLDHFVQPYYRSLEDVFALGILLSMVLTYFLAPLLGVIAIKDVFSNWRSHTNPDDDSKSEGLIRKIACRFLITGLLFAAVSLIPVVLGIFLRSLKNTNFTDLEGIWLIIMTLLALAMSCLSYKLFTKTSVNFKLRIGAIFGIIVGLVAVIAVFLSTSFGYYLIQRIEYSKMSEIPSVDSGSLNQTSIVPTLDSPCPKSKNVIWCSSFQLAWNRMKEDVIGAPVEVVGAEELAARLNSAKQTAADLEPDSVYATAGRIHQGTIDKIQKDMAAKFPSHSLPDFNQYAVIPQGILAYSYLIANVPFKYPYRQVNKEFIFTDSNGVETNVDAFGVWGYGSQYKRLREQAEILYVQEDDRYQMKEFAVDLCRHSKPYQVVAAMVEPKDSLAQTLDYISNQIADFKQTDIYERMRFLGSVDVLKVPEMFWEIDHHFDELIGKVVANANPAMPIVEAKQVIKFKLDRYGARLESESNIMVAATPRNFIFNRPFLVYMKKRDCDQPFFVMWIDNAELLNRK